jgi:hypothetical protein
MTAGGEDTINTSTTRPRVLSVALIGSSGGGAATLGHTDPINLLTSINRELNSIRRRHRHCSENEGEQNFCVVKLKYALYVSVHGGQGLDGAHPDKVRATLYTIGCDENSISKQGNKLLGDDDDDNRNASASLFIKSEYTGTLREVNRVCQNLDKTVLAKAIDDNQISGLICISCDPKNVHAYSLGRCRTQTRTIAVTGSGGTSMAYIANVYGIPLVGNVGGSVANTTYTRATSYAYALAQAFTEGDYTSDGTTYEYYHDKYCNDDALITPTIRPNIISVLNSSLPAFIAVVITKCALEQLQSVTDKYSYHDCHGNITMLMHQLQSVALPTICSILSASCYGKEHGSTVLMAAAMVGVSACHDSILAGLLGGWVVSRLADHTLWTCLQCNVPSTMTNLLLGGGVGALVLVVLVATNLTFLLQSITEICRTTLYSIMTRVPGTGFILGCAFCYGSKVGWYHKYFLPSILIEMERGDASFLGAVDELTLVLVSAGICLANVICHNSSHKHPGTIPANRGLWINLLCGDFIEAAYPYMEESWFVNLMGYIASGVSTEILLHSRQHNQQPHVLLSSAYVPVFVSIWLAKEEWQTMAKACTAALGISFIGGIVNNYFRMVMLPRTKQE